MFNTPRIISKPARLFFAALAAMALWLSDANAESEEPRAIQDPSGHTAEEEIKSWPDNASMTIGSGIVYKPMSPGIEETPDLAVTSGPSDPSTEEETVTWRDNWDVTVGAGVMYEPISPGVDDYEASPVPYLDITYRDRFFLNTERGLGAYAYKSPENEQRLIKEYAFGFAVGYEGGRDADDFDDRPELKQLGDIDPSAEAKAFAEFDLGVIDAGLEFGQGLNSGGHEGWYLELGFEADQQFTEKFMVAAGPTFRFSDSDYQQAYYGVTTQQSAATGLNKFDASSGLELISFGITGRYMFTENVGLLGLVEYQQLVGDAKDSPITDENGQFMGGLAVTYTF